MHPLVLSAAPLLFLWLGPQDGAAPPAPTGIDDMPIDALTGAEREQALAALHARLEVEYFLASDLDGNGWISFREASKALRIDRREFFVFDADRDGRIMREEFEARYRSTVKAVGSFRPPTSPDKELFTETEGTPLAYDFNGTGSLEEGELGAFLVAKNIEVPADALLSLLDKDESHALEPVEFADIVATLTPLMPALAEPADGTEPEPEKPRTIDELFGVSVKREVGFGTTPLPDRIEGPVSHFRRLDFDNDGWLEEEDLLSLLRPTRVEVRAAAVLAALDRDGDGRLSPAEFAAAMAAPAAPAGAAAR